MITIILVASSLHKAASCLYLNEQPQLICYYFLHSSTTAPPVTTTTTASPTQNPNNQYIALQSLASKTVEAAQTGRMASLVHLDILSIEVTDPEPPRKLPKGWKRATPADGNYTFLKLPLTCYLRKEKHFPCLYFYKK